MIIELDPDASVPVYEQLQTQLERLIVTDALAAGEQLPPIRRLAKDLDLAPGTVARAYRELEAAGLVTGEGRRGTLVAPREDWQQPSRVDADQQLAEAARAYALAARQLGIDPSAARATVDRAIDALCATDDGVPV